MGKTKSAVNENRLNNAQKLRLIVLRGKKENKRYKGSMLLMMMGEKIVIFK